MRITDVMALYIQAQNAGVIIRKPPTQNGHVIIECFEVAAKTEVVMGSERRLKCYYPGPSISISDREFRNSILVHELAEFLGDMSLHQLKNAQRTSKKDGGEQVETRDSTRPVYITELLMGLLLGIGGAPTESLSRIQKRIADDVVWKEAML